MKTDVREKLKKNLTVFSGLFPQIAVEVFLESCLLKLSSSLFDVVAI